MILSQDFWKSKLTAAEQADYDMLRNALLRRDAKSENLPNIPQDRVRKVCLSVYADNPDIYYAMNSSRPIYFTVDDAAYGTALKKVRDYLHRFSSAYDKILALKDYFASSVQYDKDALEKALSNNFLHADNDEYADFAAAFTSYGALVNKRAVCDGIAKATAAVLTQLGVPCIVVFGKLGSTDHSWNVVQIDGKNYHLDITNDLCVELLFFKQTYNFFLLTDTEIQKTHSFDCGFNISGYDCTAEDNSYFARNNLVFYDINKLRKYAFEGTYREALAFKYKGSCTQDYVQKLLKSAAERHCADGNLAFVVSKLESGKRKFQDNGQYFAAFKKSAEKPKRKPICID